MPLLPDPVPDLEDRCNAVDPSPMFSDSMMLVKIVVNAVKVNEYRAAGFLGCHNHEKASGLPHVVESQCPNVPIQLLLTLL